MRIRTQCRACGLPYPARLTPETRRIACPACEAEVEVDPGGWSAEQRSVEVCPLCGCRHLYRQRDFNRALGCLLVAIGAVLVPWTYGLSLVALSLFDALLYFRLSDAVVCYKCDTVYRDAVPGPRQADFELLKHDVLKYGKSWQELDPDADPAPPPVAGTTDLPKPLPDDRP